MNQIRISDATMKQQVKSSDLGLSFKEKLELSKLLDKLGVSVIEAEGISSSKVDSLRIKSIATAVRDSIVAVPVGLTAEGAAAVWAALKEAKHPRLQVEASVSAVQMLYLYGKKLPAMLEAIRSTVAACKALTSDVEFIAIDATRSDPASLKQAIDIAVEAGVTTVTVSDTAGAMLPDEFADFISTVKANSPCLENVTLGVSCSNALSMADACGIAAIRAGAGEIKASAYPIDMIAVTSMAKILAAKGDLYGVTCPVSTVAMNHIVAQIGRIFDNRSKNTTVGGSLRDEDADSVFLTIHDDIDAVMGATAKLGYELGEEDRIAVFEAFQRIASRKEQIDMRELDAIVASAAMQVPPTFTIDHYVVTTGTALGAMAHLKLMRNGQSCEGVAMGNGPVDAAFLAVEQATGCHYELDDFQIRAVTEGTEAMGETVVRLLSGGKLYSGRGISTDVIASSVQAYMNAINKIIYEEEEA